MAKTYYEHTIIKSYYRVNGDFINSIGGQVGSSAEKRISVADEDLRGQWGFAHVATTTSESHRSAQVVTNKIVFPDGAEREMVLGEVAAAQVREKSEGVVIPFDTAKGYSAQVRPAPMLRFPYGQSSLSCRLKEFTSMLDFQKFIKKQTTPVFVFDSEENIPDKKAFYIYLVVAPN